MIFPNIFGREDWLVNSIPLGFWVYMLNKEFTSLHIILVIIGIINLAVLAFFFQQIRTKVDKGMNTKEFSEYIKKHTFFLFLAFVNATYLFGTLIIMLITPKDFLLWTSICIIVIHVIYLFMRIFFGEPTKYNIKQIQHYLYEMLKKKIK